MLPSAKEAAITTRASSIGVESKRNAGRRGKQEMPGKLTAVGVGALGLLSRVIRRTNFLREHGGGDATKRQEKR
jgi:hypothetical protein